MKTCHLAGTWKVLPKIPADTLFYPKYSFIMYPIFAIWARNLQKNCESDKAVFWNIVKSPSHYKKGSRIVRILLCLKYDLQPELGSELPSR